MGESAEESQKQVDIGRFKEHLAGRMDSIKESGGWINFGKEFPGSNTFTDEERDVIETATGILKNIDALEDKDSVLKRSTKKLPEIAQAFRLLENKDGILGEVGRALESLYDAVSQFATEQELESANEALGLMTKQQIQESKERLSKINIS